MGLSGLKIMVTSITLPRPSQKGNLANIVAPILVKIIGPTVAEQGGRKRKRKKMRVSTEERTLWHLLCEARTRLCSPGYMVDLAPTKEYYRDTLHLSSK
jgi:hypothetical protein